MRHSVEASARVCDLDLEPASYILASLSCIPALPPVVDQQGGGCRSLQRRPERGGSAAAPSKLPLVGTPFLSNALHPPSSLTAPAWQGCAFTITSVLPKDASGLTIVTLEDDQLAPDLVR